MAEEDYSWMNYNRDEGPLPSFQMAFGSGKGLEEWQGRQGEHDNAPGGGPVEVQYDEDSCSETVNTETSSTGTSAAGMSSSAPIAEMPSDSQGSAISASPGPGTWSRQHNGLLVCDLCSYSSKKSSNMVSHSRTHTGERPFSCDLCPQSFKQRKHMESHRSTHRRERPYVCTICQGTYMHKKSLKNHMRIHNTELPYICETCNSQCDDKESWIRHVVQHMK